MRKRVLAVITALALLAPLAAWPKTGNTTSGKTSVSPSKSATTKKRTRSRKSWRKRGQQQIAADRNREIQAALIREGYMGGKPSGQMDAATKAALVRYQKDNGWQSSRVPDSRALIKLGLGPNHELLNPETAAIADLHRSSAAPGSSQR